MNNTRRGPETDLTSKIIITEVYDDGGDLIEIQVDAVGEAATVFDEGVSVQTWPGRLDAEAEALSEAEGMADDVEAETGRRPTVEGA